jgi:citrate lyase beta subunit
MLLPMLIWVMTGSNQTRGHTQAWHHAGMRHFDFLSAAERERLFLRAPEPFGMDEDATTLGVALGAALYCPASRPNLAVDIVRRAAHGVQTIVVCLEDSIPDDELAAAERNVVSQLRILARSGEPTPMIFVRVRSVEQIPLLVRGLGADASVLAGFVLPKFGEDTGAEFLDAVVAAGEASGRRLLAMPVLEAPEIGYIETRASSLHGTRRLLEKYRELVPAVRIGATDLSGAYGLRRARDFTIWDLRVVADVISAVVNIFGRVDAGNFVVAGPVWEYFSATERMFKPQLRE